MKEPYITQDHHDNITFNTRIEFMHYIQKLLFDATGQFLESCYFYNSYCLYTAEYFSPVCLGLLHPRIPPIPPELLVCDPLAEDRPVDVRSDLKKESAYMNETKHNLIVIKNYRNCLRTWSCSKFLPFSSHVCRMNSQT